MKPFVSFALLLLLPLQSAPAAEKLASEASVRELLQVSQARQQSDTMTAQVDSLMRNSMKQAMADKMPTAEQQKDMDNLVTKMTALVAEAVSWEQLEPQMVDIYLKTFSQSEVEGMVKFYRSKAGQALITKMPLVTENAMQLSQARMATLLPKLQQLIRDTVAELQAAKTQ